MKRYVNLPGDPDVWAEFAKKMEMLFPDECEDEGPREPEGSCLCPRCGEEGEWIRAALVCRVHGAYAGI